MFSISTEQHLLPSSIHLYHQQALLKHLHTLEGIFTSTAYIIKVLPTTASLNLGVHLLLLTWLALPTDDKYSFSSFLPPLKSQSFRLWPFLLMNGQYFLLSKIKGNVASSQFNSHFGREQKAQSHSAPGTHFLFILRTRQIRFKYIMSTTRKVSYIFWSSRYPVSQVQSNTYQLSVCWSSREYVTNFAWWYRCLTFCSTGCAQYYHLVVLPH